jgi:lipoprotein-releasing system ATP-binding protein
MSELEAVLEAHAICKTFGDGSRALSILDRADLRVMPGEMVAIVGASGSGKSTLLHILGALDHPDSGRVQIAGTDPNALDESARGHLRNRELGFVYQFHHLLGEFSAQENVAMPLWIRRMPKAQALAQAASMLERVGLAERLHHMPGQLSGGERQRVAIARALVSRPRCLLADEPTGNLDRHSARLVFDQIALLSRELGTATVVVTHDLSLARRADRLLAMQEGRLVSISSNELERD